MSEKSDSEEDIPTTGKKKGPNQKSKFRGEITADGFWQIVQTDYDNFIGLFDSQPQADRETLIKSLEALECYDANDDPDEDTFVHSCFGGGTGERDHDSCDTLWNGFESGTKQKITDLVSVNEVLCKYMMDKLGIEPKNK